LFALIFQKKFYNYPRHLLRSLSRLKLNSKWVLKETGMTLGKVLDRLDHFPLFALFLLGLDLKGPKIEIQSHYPGESVLSHSYFLLFDSGLSKNFLSLFKLNLDSYRFDFIMIM